MVAPRGALDVVVATVVAAAGNIVGMGPTTPTQAAFPVECSDVREQGP